MRIGIVVNPDAGLGGRLGFKGSDGRAAEARAAGAEDRAGPRMQLCLEHLDELLGSSLNRTKTSLTLVGLSGRMGETWYYSKSIGNYSECIGLTPPETKQQDTLELVRA